jgi:putative sterol carrier protein
MDDRLTRMFEDEAARSYDAKLTGLHGTFRFDVHDADSWRVAIDDGRVTVERAPNANADCILEGSAADVAAILRGDLRPVVALMQGRVRFRGDMSLLNRFHGWTPERNR